jgi:hypothetical protein
MPRFVVLTHDHPFLHWDLMLEQGDSLRSWRLMRPPEDGEPIDAEPLPDHRLAYLDYEGPVSGGRGTVERWDGGSYELIEAVRFAGRKLSGSASISRAEAGVAWVFHRERASSEGS